MIVKDSQPVQTAAIEDRRKLLRLRHKFLVAEYGSGQIIELSFGAKKGLTTGLEGPVAMTMADSTLYVAEAKAGRISKVDPATGKKEVFLTGVAGKPIALDNDGMGNLLVLDAASQRLYKVSTKNLAITLVAEDLPVGFTSIGSYPSITPPHPMSVSEKGDIYMATLKRGVIMLQKVK